MKLVLMVLVLLPALAKAADLPAWLNHPNCVVEIQTLSGSLPRELGGLPQRLYMRGYPQYRLSKLGTPTSREGVLLQIIVLNAENVVIHLKGENHAGAFSFSQKTTLEALPRIIPTCRK